MNKKAEGSAEKMFKEIGQKIDVLLSDLKEAAGRAEVEYADHIEELKKSGESIKNEFDDFKEKHKDRFEEAEDSLKRVGEEIEQAFRKVFSNK